MCFLKKICLGGVNPVGSVNPVCALPKVVGPCKAAVMRFYFDIEKGTCNEFTFGGCNGNGNNFKTLDDCQRTCVGGM